MLAKYGLRTFVLLYLAAIVMFPIGLIFFRTFEHGLQPVLDTLSEPDTIHALLLTLFVVVIAVPANAIFGVICSLMIVRSGYRGMRVIDWLIDIPFALSPVVAGLALVLVYGQQGWFGNALESSGFQIIYSWPGIVLATMLVSLPFVVREVAPVLREIGTEQEQAASTLGASRWQTFWRVTLPALRWGLTYGIILTTARALGEFGAVSVVSGKISGETETLTLRVEERFQNLDVTGAYTVAALLALLSVITLIALRFVNRKEPEREHFGPQSD